MKQVTIICRPTASARGIGEILRKHKVVGTMSWTAQTLYQTEAEVHPEFSEGPCQYLATIVADDSAEPLSTDLIALNGKLERGNKFLFWFADIQSIHVPWSLETSG
jgi:hypothetical protein